MAEIDVFQQGGVSEGDNQPYNIALKFIKFGFSKGEDNYLLMRLNKPLAQGHYAVLMRYKNRGRNGYWYENNDNVRPMLNKWFAFHHSLKDYYNGSIAKAYLLNQNHQIPSSEGFYDYHLYGVDKDGIEYPNICVALTKTFFKLSENEEDRIFNLTFRKPMRLSLEESVSWDNRSLWMAASFANGIAIVDNYGTVLSNIVPLKVLVRLSYYEPNLSEFVNADITDDYDVANYMMLYPNYKPRFT